jgi:eukaryotic-like serine/threonine-protein kinase
VRQCPKCGERYTQEDLSFCPADGTATTVVALSDRPSSEITGTVIDGRYRIEGRLGEGGMGVVYKASHVVLKKLLAIKVMRGEQARDGDIVQRFVQEAQASSAIGHPNIIGISDFGTAPDGSVYFAMEYLEGQTLGKAMERGPLPRERAIDIFVQIADALEAAHQRGIIHRDLKPDNIFLIRSGGRDDFVKVLDFGIAKVKNAAAKITRTGMVFGTPHYMSPEQAAGQVVDHRSDIYSVGVIMYQVFTGQLPFDAESYMGVITKHMYDPPAKPSERVPELRGAIEDIIMVALAKKPEHRYQSMLDLRDDLGRALKGAPVRATEQVALLGGDTLSFGGEGGSAREPSGRAPKPVAESEGESLVLPKRNRSVWLVAGVAGVVGFGLLVLLRPPGGDGEGTLQPAAAAPGLPQPSAASPAPSPVSAEAAPTPPASPVLVVPSPADAEVFVDGALVGRGPVSVSRPPGGGRVRASVRAPGYQEMALAIDVHSPAELRVVLEPVTEKVKARPATPKRASASSAEPLAPAARKRAGPMTEVVDPWQ